jgi:hypothetical protein
MSSAMAYAALNSPSEAGDPLSILAPASSVVKKLTRVAGAHFCDTKSSANDPLNSGNWSNRSLLNILAAFDRVARHEIT